MSDVSPQPQPKPPARNMADIARMFLDGARQSPENGGPKRMSPKDRIKPQPSAVAVESRAIPQEPPVPLPRVMLAFCNDPKSANHAGTAAAKLAKIHQATIGILSLRKSTFNIEIAGLPSAAEIPSINSAAGQPDLQIARALFTLRHIVSHWMIAAPDTDSLEFPKLAAAIADWLLITPIGNDAVVAAYQEFKRALAISSPANNPGAVMLSADNSGAATVHARLRRAAAVFLKKDLALAAVTPLSIAAPLQIGAFEVSENPEEHAAIYAAVLDELCGTVTDSETEAEAETAEEYEDEVIEPLDELSALAPLGPLAQEPFGGPPAAPALDDSQSQHSIDLDDPLDAATTAAVDLALNADLASASSSALFDHLTNVLDPEERDALNADLFDTETAAESVAPTARSTGFSLEQVQPKGCTPNAAASSPMQTVFQQLTLRVHDLLAAPDLSRPAQWQAILGAIPDLSPNAILLDAKAPMSWATESALTLLPDGSLHVWMLEGKDASWFAMKEWATEHRPLLALTHRTLMLNTETPITVHLVLPPKDSSTDSPSLLRTPSPTLHLYRLHPLEYNTQHALIVVPLA